MSAEPDEVQEQPQIRLNYNHPLRELLWFAINQETDSIGLMYSLINNGSDMVTIDKLFETDSEEVVHENQNNRAFAVMKEHGKEVVIYFRNIGLRCDPTNNTSHSTWVVCKNKKSQKEDISPSKIHEYINKYVIERIELPMSNVEIYNRSKYREFFHKMLKYHIERWSGYTRVAFHPKRLKRIGFFD